MRDELVAGYMTLSKNKLSGLPEDVFDGLHNLSTLRLDYSQLTKLRPGVFNGLPSLRSLHLRNNPGSPLPVYLWGNCLPVVQGCSEYTRWPED